jgi:hypothetical protein
MINFAADSRARLDNLLQLNFYEVVVGVDMLLHQSLDLQKGWQQIPFVAGRVDRIRKRLVIVERFQERIEWVDSFGLTRMRLLISLIVLMISILCRLDWIRWSLGMREALSLLSGIKTAGLCSLKILLSSC